MQHTPSLLCRGAVLSVGPKRWLLWEGDICLAIRVAHEPRSRWVAPLSLKGFPKNLVIHGDDRKRVDTALAVFVGCLSTEALSLIERQFSRAAESEAIEARFKLKA